MRKIAILGICLLFIGVSLAAAAPRLQEISHVLPLNPTGTFGGSLGYMQGDNATIVGNISGTYKLGKRGGGFNGEWSTENHTGMLRGIFGKHILIGKISTMINGTEKSLPIVGFIGAKNGEFLGRAMAPIGPALYFWGTYN